MSDMPIVSVKAMVETKIVTLALEAGHPNLKDVLKIITGALERFPQCELVVKVHPEENKKRYVEALREIGSVAKVLQGVDLYGLLNASEFVVTHGSTVGLEALVAGKPVIILSPEDNYHDIYSNTKAVFRVKNQEELEEAIKTILYDKEKMSKVREHMKEFVYNYAYKQDGKSLERLAEVVKEMVFGGVEK